MAKQGALFSLGRDMKVYNNLRLRRKPVSANFTVQPSFSAGFFDDGQPIILSLPGNDSVSPAAQWVEDLDYPGDLSPASVIFTEDAEYTLMSGWDNESVSELTHDPAPEGSLAQTDTIPVPHVEREIHEDLPSATPSDGNLRDPLKVLGKAASALDDSAFAADLASILEGNKVFDPEKKVLIDSAAVNDGFIDKLKEADARRDGAVKPNAAAAPGDDAQAGHEHSIFDKIAQNMSFANAFELGAVEMEHRFDAFDRAMTEAPSHAKPDMKQAQEGVQVNAAPERQPTDLFNAGEAMRLHADDFVADLGLIKAASEAMEDVKKGAAWPPKPAGMSPLDLDGKKSAFGMFAYEAAPTADNPEAIRITDDWPRQHIEWVDIPQLAGKISGNESGNRKIAKGGMEFHKTGSSQLKAMFADWERAGLLDRIITFNGSYVPRYVRGTQPDQRSDQHLSNHAWGSAFDINAEWNPRGSVPALTGQKGSVRELVEIANRHGFYWGGHFGGSSVDGMHFELVRIQ